MGGSTWQSYFIAVAIFLPSLSFLVQWWLEMGQVRNYSSQSVPGARASWKGTWSWQLSYFLSSGRMSASLEICNCFLAGAQENKCWLRFLVPLASQAPPPATHWHHNQWRWLAGSIMPYYEMSPDLEQTSPCCWWPTWLIILLGSGLIMPIK